MEIFIIHSGADRRNGTIDKIKEEIISGCQSDDNGKGTEVNISVMVYNNKKRKYGNRKSGN